MIDFDMSKALVAVDSMEQLRSGHFKKHIAVIYVKGTLNPLEKRLWNLLTKNAQHCLADERHEIPVEALMRAADIHGNDRRMLKPALIKLRKTSIEWVRQNSEGGYSIDSDWAESGYLSSVAIVNGIVYYEYSRFLREQLMNPERFALLHVESGNALKRGKANTLYEITARFRPNEKSGFPGGTPKWPLDFFRTVMGAEAKTYDEFKKLNQKIIQPCVRKINEETDIKLTPEFYRRGRRVVQLKFKVETNSRHRPSTGRIEKDSENVKRRLIEEYGIGEVESEVLMAEYSAEYLNEKIAYIEHQIESGKDIQSISGYLRKAIKENYRITTSAVLRKQREAERTKARLEREAQEARKRKEQERLEENQRLALAEKVNAFLNSLPLARQEKLRASFESKMEANPIWQGSWSRRKENRNFEAIFDGLWRDFVREEMNTSREFFEESSKSIASDPSI